MLIPLIPKNPDLTDFNCRDGEIDFVYISKTSQEADTQYCAANTLYCEADTPYCAANTPYCAANTPYREANTPYREANTLYCAADTQSLSRTLRIPLQSGDRPKAELMLSGEISRVDPATAERLTQAIVEKAAQCLLDLSTDLRRQGLFILPFRAYTMLQTPDGTLSYPSPQAIVLPTDFPPHPEITAASATDDALTLAIRFPVKAHRLSISPSTNLPAGYSIRTFISYPLYIPDPKEMRGSLGSVRSAGGGNATGIRFAFLSTSAIKASVAAPEKYYEMVGNERTGYRLSSKAASAPDYSCYAAVHGYVPPFTRESLLALGEGMDTDTDPLDWIADWVKAEEGYLPATLPYKYRHPSDKSDSSDMSDLSWPDGIDADAVRALADSIGADTILLTRPMTLAASSASRRHATAKSIRTLRVLGLKADAPALALLYGSDDGVRWTPLRRFDPRVRSSVLTPPRLFWRVLIMYCHERGPKAIFLE